MSRTRKLIALVLASVAIVAALPAVATAAPTALESMRVMSQQMGDGSLVRVMASVPSATVLPATVEILIPKEFTFSSAQLLRSTQFSDEKAAEPIGEAKYKTEDRDGDTAYIVTLSGADTVLLELVAPAGIYSAVSGGHATIQLGLLAATDIKYLEYGFVLPMGAEAVGKDVVIFGTTNEGLQIAGQVFEDVKAGERQSAQIAIGASNEAATAAVSQETSSTAAAWLANKNNLIVMALIAAVVLIGAVAAAIALGRRRAMEAAEFAETDDEFDDVEYDESADADDELVASDEAADSENEPVTKGAFFRD